MIPTHIIYSLLILLFIISTLLHALLGITIPLVLCAAIMLLFDNSKPQSLKLFAMGLVCLEHFLWFDQLIPPLLYIAPLYYAAPRLKQFLLPATAQLLPFALFTLAFIVANLIIIPLSTGVLPPTGYTFLSFCGSMVVMYISLKYISQRQFR